MSLSVSAIGVVPVQPVPPISYQAPDDGIAPIEAPASPADETGSGGPDVLYQPSPQWYDEQLTYSNLAAPLPVEPLETQSMEDESQPSDAIYAPDDDQSWATEAAMAEPADAPVEEAPADESEPLEAAQDAPIEETPAEIGEAFDQIDPAAPDEAMIAEEIAAEEAMPAPLDGAFEAREAPEWLAEEGAAPVADAPGALAAEEISAQDLLEEMWAEEALSSVPDEMIAPPEDAESAPERIEAAIEDVEAPPPDLAEPLFAGPVDDAQWQSGPVEAPDIPENDAAAALPAASDAAIVATTGNGRTEPIAVPATASAPASAARVAATRAGTQAFDPLSQASLGAQAQGPSAQASAIAQAAYEMVARVSGESPTLLDQVKLA